MTLETLNRHFDLLTQRDKARGIVDALRLAACPGAQKLDGMPRSSGVSDKVGDLAVEIADLDAQIESINEEIRASEIEISSYIQSIDDVQARVIFSLRFLRGLPWKDVATAIGGHNTEHSVRMICYRYLNA